MYTEWCGVSKRSAEYEWGSAGELMEEITGATIGDGELDPTGEGAYASGCGRRRYAEANQATFVVAKQAATQRN